VAQSSPSDRSSRGEDLPDLRAVLAKLWSRRLWILASAILFATVFGVAAFNMTPVYVSSTVLVPANNDRSGLQSALGSTLGQLSGLAALVGVGVNTGNAQTQEALAVLRSREFTERFIRDENLMPELFREQWDAAAGRWLGDEEDWPTYAQAYQYFHDSIRTVTLTPQTGLVTLSIEWTDPEKCALWANRLVERLNEEVRSRAIANANASIGFLERELQSTSTIETRQAINRLMEVQINQRMLANVTHEYAFRVADRALPPDSDDEIRPNKPFLLLLGLLFGMMVGAVATLIAKPRRSLSPQTVN
jgi:uncharacterized protein involved in exopolysaccharide biosynthesis